MTWDILLNPCCYKNTVVPQAVSFNLFQKSICDLKTHNPKLNFSSPINLF